jgi:hypothetical protein
MRAWGSDEDGLRRAARCARTAEEGGVSDSESSRQIDCIRQYFRRIDAGEFAAELFAPDFQFYFPKFGVGRGPGAFLQLVRGLMTTVERIAHHPEDFVFIETGNKVAVEGTTEGSGINGVEWRGGVTPGGRFCSIFVFDSQGLIERMHIYLDPDYTGADRDRFLWSNAVRVGW